MQQRSNEKGGIFGKRKRKAIGFETRGEWPRMRTETTRERRESTIGGGVIKERKGEANAGRGQA